MRVEADPWAGPEGWLSWSAHPLGGAVCRDHVQDPDFAPSTSEVAVGFLVFFVFFFLISLFIYFWLCWVFVAARRLSLVVASGDYSSLWCTGFSLWWLLLLRSTGSRHAGFSSCTWAQ